jgi:hypothetical protein
VASRPAPHEPGPVVFAVTDDCCLPQLLFLEIAKGDFSISTGIIVVLISNKLHMTLSITFLLIYLVLFSF